MGLNRVSSVSTLTGSIGEAAQGGKEGRSRGRGTAWKKRKRGGAERRLSCQHPGISGKATRKTNSRKGEGEERRENVIREEKDRGTEARGGRDGSHPSKKCRKTKSICRGGQDLQSQRKVGKMVRTERGLS